MKFVKGISLYFIYPMIMLCSGFYGGVVSSHFFYPGEQLPGAGGLDVPSREPILGEPVELQENLDYGVAEELREEEELSVSEEELLREAAAASETLSADPE